MEFRTYLEHVRADSERILALAPGNLEREVPCCPGWKVQEVVRHLAEVYEHKILCTELAARPDPWPPAWPPERDPLEWLGDAQGRLLELLSSKGAKTPSWTWYPPEQTAGFWGRRMAHETVIHRVDVELAVGSISPVEPELGLDGIDEVLQVCLAGDWKDEPLLGLEPERVEVKAGQRSWLVEQRSEWVQVTPGAGEAVALVSGEPGILDRWLWGRAGDLEVERQGDQAALRRLRERLRLATQ